MLLPRPRIYAWLLAPWAHLYQHPIFQFVDFNNWEVLHTLSHVCKSWRRIASPHISPIGVVPMNGGADKKLNLNEFLAYLTRPIFQYAESIYIPCGKSTDRMYVDDIKQICPTVRTIYHSIWLLMTGIKEFVTEGSTCHSVYLVYKHNHEYTEGVAVWMKYLWDNKYNLVLESSFDRSCIVTRHSCRCTDFFRYWDWTNINSWTN